MDREKGRREEEKEVRTYNCSVTRSPTAENLLKIELS